MLGNRKLLVDTHSGVSEYLRPWIDEEFWNLNSVDRHTDAIYVVCRQTVVEANSLIKELVSAGAKIVLSIPEEGSETLLAMCLRWELVDLIQQGNVILISGGDMHPRWTHIQHEFFLPKIYYCEHNQQVIAQSDKIFTQNNKPYKFLFLNGRTRSHRKYLLERFELSGLLNQSLWTNLDSSAEFAARINSGPYFNNDHFSSDIQLNHKGTDLMSVNRPVKYLPAEYEVDRYQERINMPPPENLSLVEYHLWNNEWGAVYLNFDAYVDTYFSLVTETVFTYPYSFRTEKIWKPIAMGHPWIAVANSGFYRDLRNLGFQTFDGIIDESFDNIERSQDRIERIAQVVEDLCQQDLDQFLKECYNICKYNQQHYAEMSRQSPADFPNQLYQFLIRHQ